MSILYDVPTPDLERSLTLVQITSTERFARRHFVTFTSSVIVLAFQITARRLGSNMTSQSPSSLLRTRQPAAFISSL